MQRSTLTPLAIGLVSAMLLVTTGCTDDGSAEASRQPDVPERQDPAPEPGVVKRDGEPDFIRTQGDEVLARGVAKAKQTYKQFIEALENPAPTHDSHAVKKPFATPGGGFEHIWINEVTWDGKVFHGVINNVPVDTDRVKQGDKVTVTPDELSDWMYIDDSTVVGGFTVRALHYQQSPEDQRAFLEQTGLKIPPIDF